jgi:hypothetical protein
LLLTRVKDWINNFIIGLITPPLVQKTGFGAYIFFAVFCVISFVWVWFAVPETKGKTLEEMDEVFNDRSGVEDVAKKERVLRNVFERRVADLLLEKPFGYGPTAPGVREQRSPTCRYFSSYILKLMKSSIECHYLLSVAEAVQVSFWSVANRQMSHS